MKIKKKEYNRQLQDKYWEGVQMGMRIGIDNPGMAKKYVDNIPMLRQNVDRAGEILKGIVKSISDTLKR